MELHNLKPAAGAVKNSKRIARGTGSGHGGTSTRGHKGDKARSGHKRKRHFEGGQMPIQMRLPKIGFKNVNRVAYIAVNLDKLQTLADRYKLSAIDFNTLVDKGVVNKNDKVKLLARGELKAKISVTVHACSAAAKQAIEALGGSVNLV
ncbi:MAG: 50S ribosomal protein L15 [Saprospiraceae bacterium]|jgi:large subunit ribosomal protein L15|nr:50S ribosomal protein L15 [Saprospiraceae bacterium]MBL7791804.1 50S ribosomal protein L15 [Saprospiraceae bacterium]NUQ25249.1 50S ribosomal protein L15 [Saprospiraceae bacterium]